MADEDRITRIAQALCVADGHDPEEPVYVGSEVIGTDGADHYREVIGPAWTSYADEARRLVTPARALGLLE